MDFKPTPNAIQDRELLDLKLQHGGQLGELVFGGLKLPVLRLRENIYATSGAYHLGWDVIANMEGADIHEVRRPADAIQLSQRLREFDNGA